MPSTTFSDDHTFVGSSANGTSSLDFSTKPIDKGKRVDGSPPPRSKASFLDNAPSLAALGTTRTPFFQTIDETTGGLVDAVKRLDEELSAAGRYHLISHKSAWRFMGRTTQPGCAGLYTNGAQPRLILEPGRYPAMLPALAGHPPLVVRNFVWRLLLPSSCGQPGRHRRRPIDLGFPRQERRVLRPQPQRALPRPGCRRHGQPQDEDRRQLGLRREEDARALPRNVHVQQRQRRRGLRRRHVRRHPRHELRYPAEVRSRTSFKGETARTLDSLTVRALAAQVEAANIDRENSNKGKAQEGTLQVATVAAKQRKTEADAAAYTTIAAAKASAEAVEIAARARANAVALEAEADANVRDDQARRMQMARIEVNRVAAYGNRTVFVFDSGLGGTVMAGHAFAVGAAQAGGKA